MIYEVRFAAGIEALGRLVAAPAADQIFIANNYQLHTNN